MGAEIDRLEVQIEAEAAKASKQLDDIVKKLGLLAEGISAIRSNKGLEDFERKAKDISKSLQSVQSKAKEMVKSIDEPLKKVSKSLEQLEEQYKDLGKDYQFFGDAQSTQKKIESLSNALETAKLRKQELEASGKTNGQMYENAVKDVIKYKNMIESLQSKLEEISKKNFSYPAPQTSKYENDITKHLRGIGAYGLLDDYIKGMEEAEQNIAKMSEKSSQAAQGIKDSFAQVSEPLKEIDLTLADFSMKATEALSKPQEESKRFSANLNGLKDVLYGIQERFLEFKGRLENTFVSKGLKTYTSEYVELQNQITKTEKTLATLNAQMARSRETVKNFEGTTSYRKMQYDIKAAKEELQRLREEQDRLEVSGGATKWNFKGLAVDAKSFTKTLHPLQNALKKILSTINSVLSKVGKLAKSMISLGTATKKSNTSFSSGLKTILKYGFGIRSLYVLFNKLRNAIKEGMENLIQYSERTNASVSMLSSSLNQLKNASAAAIAPLLNAIAPALNTLIQLFIKAANAVNQFFSALTGNGTWIKAKYVYEDVAAGISDAAKAAKGALQPFDALNNLTTQDDSGAGAVSPEDMFETVPVEDKFKDLADKVKDILSKLFAPLKEAWDREGQFVMDSWKYALDEIWKLIKDIGRDFLEVWNQPETVDMLADILHIIGDIGLVVGHLARNFREAWNENKTGLHILENIRDIFAVIIANIRHAADATVEWADKLDFSPLLEAFERFTESLIPVADSLSGILTDFYEKVLLPLGTWTIEKGLPELLDVFTAFNEKVDWESLRSNLAEFWEHLEPFAETVGEGLIIFIERVSNALADFLNSQEFKDFLVSVEEWMDKVTPEDVADGIEKIAKALVVLKAATTGLSVLSSVISPLKDLAITIALFGGGSGASSTAGAIGTIGAQAGLAISPIMGVVAAIAALVGGLAYVFATNEEVRESFSQAITAIQEGMQPAIEFLTGTLLPDLKSGFERILEVLSPLGEFLQGVFTSIWQDMINPVLTYIGEKVLPKVTEAFENLWNNVLVPLGSFLADVLEPVIQVVSDVLQLLWENVVVPLADAVGNVLSKAFEGLCDIFNDTVVPIVNTIIEVFQFLWDNVLSPIADYLIETLQPVFENVFKAIGGVIEGLGTALGGLIDFIAGVFTGDWERAWNGVKDIFKGIFNGLASIAEGVINNIISGLNSFLSGFNSITSSVGSKVGLNITIPKIPNVSLPRFATGGFPEDGLFMANHGELVGQFSNGKTAVANNEQITEGIAIAVRNANSEQNALLREQNQLLRAILEKEGSGVGDIFDTVRSEYQSKAKQLGVRALDPVLG